MNDIDEHAFPEGTPYWTKQLMLAVNFGSAILSLDGSPSTTRWGEEGCVNLRASFEPPKRLAVFSHIARKAASPISSLKTILLKDDFLSLLGLCDLRAPNGILTTQGPGLARHIRALPGIVDWMRERRKCGGLNLRWEGKEVSADEFARLADPGEQCTFAGTHLFEKGLSIGRIPSHHERNEHAAQAFKTLSSGSNSGIYTIPAQGAFDAYASVDDEGELVDLLLLKRGSNSDLASTFGNPWTMHCTADSRACIFAPQELAIDDALSQACSHFIHDLDRSARRDRARPIPGALLFFGADSDGAPLYIAHGHDNEIIGIRMSFGLPSPTLLDKIGAQAALREAKDLMDGTPTALRSKRSTSRI